MKLKTRKYHDWTVYRSSCDTSTLITYVSLGISTCKKCGKLADWNWMEADCEVEDEKIQA